MSGGLETRPSTRLQRQPQMYSIKRHADKHIGPSPPCRYRQGIFRVGRLGNEHPRIPIAPAVHIGGRLPSRLLPPRLLIACTHPPKGRASERNHNYRIISSTEFQAPNSIDRSISWRLWLIGTTTRKSQLSPATRKRVRMDRSNPPHCPACGDMPAGASRARTDPARPFLNHRSYPNRCSGENRCIDTFGGALRQYVRADAGGNPGRRFLHRISREMGVAGRRLDLAVTEQLADRRQALAQRQGT